MSIERQTLMNTQAIRGMMGLLIGKLDALGVAPTPTVDFAVDMFDRQDQDTLGDYWSNTSYAIRNNTVVLATGNAPVITTVGYISTSYAGQSGITSYGMNPFTAPGSVVYEADISNNDFMCKISAIVPIYDNIAPPRTFIDDSLTANYSHYLSVITDAYKYRQVGAGAGVCVANSQNAAFGVAAQTAHAPSQNVAISHLAFGESAAASTPPTVVSRVAIGSDKLVSAMSEDAAVTVSDQSGGSNATAVIYPAKFNVMLVGTNTIIASCSGSTVSISINGAGVYSGTPNTTSARSRSRAGIMTGPESVTAALDVATQSRSGGVTAFKVWRNDIPEPPNESGHGTYVNGRWQYVDKYHTPNTDAEGNVVRNEDGTVASYTYDPEA